MHRWLDAILAEYTDIGDVLHGVSNEELQISIDACHYAVVVMLCL